MEFGIFFCLSFLSFVISNRFCAHEYEKSKDMAAAALAYKCMEVAYMRVIYFSHNSASRDRHELQSALQMVPPGNLNNAIFLLCGTNLSDTYFVMC